MCDTLKTFNPMVPRMARETRKRCISTHAITVIRNQCYGIGFKSVKIKLIDLTHRETRKLGKFTCFVVRGFIQGCRVLLRIPSLNCFAEERIYLLLLGKKFVAGNSLSLIRVSDTLNVISKEE